MSALGEKQTLGRSIAMSAIPPKADIDGRSPDVRFVPKADILRRGRPALFGDLVGKAEQLVGNGEAKRLGGLEVNHELELSRLIDRQVRVTAGARGTHGSRPKERELWTSTESEEPGSPQLRHLRWCGPFGVAHGRCVGCRG